MIAILTNIPGCAGDCHSSEVHRGNPAPDHHILLAVRIRQEVRRRSLVPVHRSQPAHRILGAVAALLRVDLGRNRHVEVVLHRRIVPEEAMSSCYVVRRADQTGLLVGRTREVRYRCRFRWTLETSCGYSHSHHQPACYAVYSQS
jgi:hypothetical protein